MVITYYHSMEFAPDPTSVYLSGFTGCVPTDHECSGIEYVRRP